MKREYNIKFLLLGAEKTGKSELLRQLVGYLRYDSIIRMEEFPWCMNDVMINGLIQDLQSIDLMSAVVVPYVKASGVIFLCYDSLRPETIDFLEEWMKRYFKYIPATSHIYFVCINDKLSPRVMDLVQTYFCCRHVSVNLQHETSVEKLFERAGNLFFMETGTKRVPGLIEITNRSRRSYCWWW